MHKEEVSEEPFTQEPRLPLWVPPMPPEPDGKEWIRAFFERFGFLIAACVTISVLIFLFVKADDLLKEPGGQATTTAPSEQEKTSVASADEVTPAASASSGSSPRIGVALSITTHPPDAALFIEGEPVGLAPLRDYTMQEGLYRISARKQDYSPLDTLIRLRATSRDFRLTLRPVGRAVVAEAAPAPPAEEPEDRGPANQSAGTDAERTPPAPSTQAVPEDRAERSPRVADNDEPEPTPAVEAHVPPPPPARGALRVVSEPAGASVWMADQQVGVTPLRLGDVPAGSRRVTLRLAGYEDYTATVTVSAREEAVVAHTLKQHPGTLKILAKPWGTIYIDGELFKQETNIWNTARLAPGDYRVRVEHPTLGKWEQVIAITAGREREVIVDFNTGDSSSQ